MNSFICVSQLGRGLPLRWAHRRWSGLQGTRFLSVSQRFRSEEQRPPFTRYGIIEGVEELEHYRPGGYHPVCIGDRFHDRYLIVHKLGHGGYSTIWLARDDRTNKYVAIKISMADAESKEGPMMREIRAAAGLQRGADSIPPVLDEFEHTGPNGTHACLVTIPAQMDLYGEEGEHLFQLPVARAMTAQLIQAVACLHTQGVVHGDINLRNIMLRLPQSLDGKSIDELYEKYGAPKPEEVYRLMKKPPQPGVPRGRVTSWIKSDDKSSLPPGVPSHGFMPIRLGKLGSGPHISLRDAKILLIDFGVAFRPLEKENHVYYTPCGLQPPESLLRLQQPNTFSADIWTLACCVWNIMGESSLFMSFWDTPDDALQNQVDTFGKFPDEWWQKWEARSKWFNEDGSSSYGSETPCNWEHKFKVRLLEPRVKAYGEEGGMGEDEARCLSLMLRSMLLFKPEERATAAELLNCEWMRVWGLPEVEKMKAMQ